MPGDVNIPDWLKPDGAIHDCRLMERRVDAAQRAKVRGAAEGDALPNT
jgi:hypothetical protein